MRILIRVDAAGKYGLGHMMRMKPLADMLLTLGDDDLEVAFLTTSGIPRDLAGEIDVYRFKDNLSEYQVLEHAVSAFEPDIIIIDRKDFYDAHHLRTLRKHCRVIRIDHPWAEEETCDLIVIPNFHQGTDKIEKLDAAFGDALLYGPEYVILREEIRKLSRRPYHRRKAAIIFTTGGSDPEGWLPMFYDMTESLAQKLPSVRRYYCIGKYAAPFIVDNADPKAFVTGYCPTYIQESALVVGLFGVTAYEALYLGTPMCSIGHTNMNAVGSGILAIATEGSIQDFSQHRNSMREDFCAQIADLWNDKDKRRNMHSMSDGLFDGLGAQRIAEAILGLERQVIKQDGTHDNTV